MGKNNKFKTGTYDEVIIAMAKHAICDQRQLLKTINDEAQKLGIENSISDFTRVLRKRLQDST